MGRDLEQARLVFGRTLEWWMQSNKLSSLCLQHWGQAAGQSGPWTAQTSQLIHGTLLSPKVELWCAFGELNRQIASKDITPMDDSKNRAKLLKAEPLLNAAGNPSTTVDLFACFIGDAQFHLQTQPPEMSEESVKQECKRYRTAFNALAQRRFAGDRNLCWLAFVEASKSVGIPPQLLPCIKDCLSGWKDLSLEECQALMLPGGDCLIAETLQLLEES